MYPEKMNTKIIITSILTILCSAALTIAFHAIMPASVDVGQLDGVLVTLFGNAKLDELVNVVTDMPVHEKRAAYETLRNIYPTQTAALERLQRTNR